MSNTVSMMAWPGPNHFPHPPSLALRLDKRHPIRDMYRALCAQLRADHQAGRRQVLLPPPQMEEFVPDPDPEWTEIRWRSMDIDTQAWACFIPGSDTLNGLSALMVANRCNERAGAWTGHRLAVFQQLFADVPAIQVHEPLPGMPLYADTGELNHLRLQVGEGFVHLFTYDDSVLLPEQMRSKQLKRQSRAAILSHIERAGLRPGHSIIARQHWKSADAGAAGIRDMSISCGDTLLLHESACGDQHEIVTALDRLVPGLRLEIIRDGSCRLRDMRKHYGLGAEILVDGQNQRHLRYDPRWDDRRGQRLREDFLSEGYCNQHHAGMSSSLTGLRHNALWNLHCHLTNDQWLALYDAWKVTDGLLDALDAWVESAVWPELRVEDFSKPDRVSDLRRIQDDLYTLLPPVDSPSA